MKTVKRIPAFLLALALFLGIFSVAGLPAQKAQAADRLLTFDRAIQVDDYHIVLEFSEPIAINLKGMNRGPHCSIRIVGSNYSLQWKGAVTYGTALQWQGSLEYLDSKHDRLVYTLTATTLGVTCIADITNFRGELAKYSKFSAAFCLEEVPFETEELINNGLLDNITTADGEEYLWSNRPGGWDGSYQPIEIDYSYPADFSKTESVERIPERTESAIALGTGVAQEDEPVVETVTVVKNDPVVFCLLIGGGLVVGALIAIVLILILRKRKGGAAR